MLPLLQPNVLYEKRQTISNILKSLIHQKTDHFLKNRQTEEQILVDSRDLAVKDVAVLKACASVVVAWAAGEDAVNLILEQS